MTREEALKIVAEAYERGERPVLSEADLFGANLTEADLFGANLTEADLREANLRGAYLRGANLCGANLGGANLCGANLGGAYLGGADLREANLRGADLRGANLRGAYLGGADLRGAYLRWAKGAGAIEPIGSRGDTLVWNIRQGTIWFYTGCFGGTEAEFLAAVEKEHGDNEHGRAYRAAVELIRILAGPCLKEEDDGEAE